MRGSMYVGCSLSGDVKMQQSHITETNTNISQDVFLLLWMKDKISAVGLSVRTRRTRISWTDTETNF